MDVVSKFKYGKVAIHLAVTMMFTLGLAYMLIFTSFLPSGLKAIVTAIFCWIIVLLGVFSLYEYAVELTWVRVDAKGVRIKSLFKVILFTWEEVKNVKNNIRNQRNSISPFRLYHLEVFLEDDRCVPIYYEYHTNGHLIQQYIQHYFKRRKSLLLRDEERISQAETANESFMTFKGLPLVSFRGFVIGGMILLMIAIMTTGLTKSIVNIVFFAGAFLVFLLNLLFCFYIQVSENYLILKNYFLPFIGKSYRISEIGDLSIEGRSKLPNCLRIVGKSFRYHVIPCATLRNKDWRAFIKLMSERKRRVRANIF